LGNEHLPWQIGYLLRLDFSAQINLTTKTKTGGSRPAGRHTFARQQK
jgi:hypothetical protein